MTVEPLTNAELAEKLRGLVEQRKEPVQLARADHPQALPVAIARANAIDRSIAEFVEAHRDQILAALDRGIERETYAEWQQKRGMLADTVDWAILEYDEYMKDDAYDAQAVLDRIIAKLRDQRAIAAMGEKT